MKIVSLNNLTNIIDSLMDIEHGKECSYSVKSSCIDDKILKTLLEVINSVARNSIKPLLHLMTSLVM